MQDSVIDWELAIRLAGNSREFAEKMFALLVRDLPTELAEIKKSYADKNFEDLKHRVHKLHGALCYCGAPRLKNATAALETAVNKPANPQIPALLTQFELEANELIRQVSCPSL